MYKHLFFDLDHTLWDFDANAKTTLADLHSDYALQEKGIPDFEVFYKNYLLHNEILWERYRKGLIRQQELRYKRMWLTLLDFKIADEFLAKEMSTRFLDKLPTRTRLFPYTMEILKYLQHRGYVLHLITNGFDETQHSKLRYSGLTPFFKEVITSECSNCLKPQKEIFEYAFKRCVANPQECIMIGDNFEADIQGAINAGIDQVHVNFQKLPTPVKPTYTIHSLKELELIF
ncbi:MAG: noncanonical pyrimidine nucleotidase, YjjG family [Chitinophagaceae bacterium]|jgi:putative hydrolase of the HAD superfamily|nr:noncanonical pyrimidine nucleotidase, YjjG family [Chitinophagaceae bacterium]